jgi:hypothetical protein
MPLARLWASAALAVCLLLAGPLAPAAHAASIPLTFTGGSGSPLTITLAQPATYTVATAPTGGSLFDFKGVGNVFGGAVNVSGTMTYTINGGAPISINVGSTNTPAGTIAVNDLLLNKNPVPGGAALGDVFVLSPGSVTTAVNVSSAAPANGSYPATLVDPNGNQIAVGVPEPASLSLLAVGGLALLARRRTP